MTARQYILTMPVAPGQFVTVWSNGPMEMQHFDRLTAYLALQREIVAEDVDASGIVAATAGEAEGLDERSEQSPVGNAETPKPPSE